jgi:uncharacterized protein YgiM (DUF1202 family)
MRILLFMLLLLPGIVAAQPFLVTKTGYVAHKAGLSIREKPDVKSKVLEKIPYGAKITLNINHEIDTVTLVTDGMFGYFRKTTFNGKTGYVIDCYLFEFAPPKAGTKTLKEYLGQLTTKFGAELVVKNGSMNQISEGGYVQKKQLYKNGAEWQDFSGYEYGSETVMLPNMNIQQAYILLRLIPEFKDVITEKEEFPSENKEYKKGDYECSVKVTTMPGVTTPLYGIEKIRIEYSYGAYSFIEIYRHENDIVIFWGSGV